MVRAYDIVIGPVLENAALDVVELERAAIAKLAGTRVAHRRAKSGEGGA
jgi:hypothetical protein